jgi:hypothetical protein
MNGCFWPIAAFDIAQRTAAFNKQAVDPQVLHLLTVPEMVKT